MTRGETTKFLSDLAEKLINPTMIQGYIGLGRLLLTMQQPVR